MISPRTKNLLYILAGFILAVLLGAALFGWGLIRLLPGH
jgi:cytochrome c oxidase assembly factor CtaG